MAGPTQNLAPGYLASMASAIKWAEECQKVDLPSLSSQVSSFSDTSVVMARVASQTCPFTLAASTFLANPSLMDLAISSAETPLSYWRIAPSGNVTLIIFSN